MNKLTKYLIESILKEDSKIKKVVGIYGGRFQPFGPHHLKTYKWLEKQCDEAYITTSNIKKPPRHPMNFKEKVRHMSKMGVPANKIIEEKSPYVAKNLAKKFDEETTVFVYVFGAKDAGRLGGGGKYFQDYKKNMKNLKGHGENGYYLVAPHVSISVGGKEVSGTTMRALLGSPKVDDSAREKLFKKMFGYSDKGVFQMMTNKFKKLFESLNESKQEFVIWGIPPKKSSEEILYTKAKSQGEAKKVVKVLTDKHGVKKARIQVLDLEQDPSKFWKSDKIFEFNVPIKVGDTVLMGKFKNKKVKVKSITINDKGDMLINGKSASKFRLIKQPNIFDENLKESSTNAGYSADAGEPETGYISPGKKRTIGKGAQPDSWYKKGGYEQVDFPVADDPYGDDANRRISIHKVVNPDIYIDTIKSNNYVTVAKEKESDKAGKNFVRALTDNVILDFLSTIDLKKIIKEAATTNVSVGGNSQGVDDGPRYFGVIKKFFEKNEKLAGKMGWKVIRLLVGKDTPEIYGFDTNYPNGPVGSVSFAPAGYVKKKADRVEREDIIGKGAYTKYVQHINVVATRLGYEIIDYLGAELISKHSLGQKEISKEKPDEVDSNRNKAEFKGQKVEESLFTKQWWKDILNEGGAYGHMAHPFDDKDLTFGDLKKIIELGLGGNLNREDNVTEKLDGQNLMVSWIDGKLRIARNKGHIKNFGKTSLDSKGIASKFKGRGEIANAFNFAVKDLEKAVKSLSVKQQDKIFNSGKHWMNLEVMWPKSANVIDYDVANIVFHGALIYDEKANVRGEVKGSARILAGMIEQVNKHIGTKYSIGKPNFLDVPKHQDFSKMKSKFLSRLDKLRNEYALKDSDTLGLHHQSYWEEYIYNAAQQFGYDIQDGILENLTKRWAFFDKSYKIPTIKKDLKDEPKFLDWVLSTDKNDHAKMVKDNMKPFEILFFDVGAQILKNVEGYIAANPDKAVQSMRKELTKAISDLNSGGDIKKLDRLKVQLDRLNAIGGLDAIVPTEGIVFKYKGNTYKFTGAFAPVNQIMGLITF